MACIFLYKLKIIICKDFWLKYPLVFLLNMFKDIRFSKTNAA